MRYLYLFLFSFLFIQVNAQTETFVCLEKKVYPIGCTSCDNVRTGKVITGIEATLNSKKFELLDPIIIKYTTTTATLIDYKQSTVTFTLANTAYSTIPELLTALGSCQATGSKAVIDTLLYSNDTLSISFKYDSVAAYKVKIGDQQYFDTASFSSDTLRLSIYNDKKAQTKIYIPSGGGGSDDQKFDTAFILNDTIYLSLESDGEAVKKLSLEPYLDNTDGQTLAWSSSTGLLTITGGNAVNLDGRYVTSITHDIVTNGNVITSTVNGIADTTLAVRSVSNTSSANNLSTTVNGVTGSNVNIINSNVLNLSGNQLTETINGVSDTSLVIGNVVQTLSSNNLSTTVNGVSSNTVSLAGYVNTDNQNINFGTKSGNDVPLNIDNGVGVTFTQGANIYLDRVASNFMTIEGRPTVDTFSFASKNLKLSLTNDLVNSNYVYLGMMLDTASYFNGDVSGLYQNLQIGTGTVGSAEIANGSIATVDIADSAITEVKLISNSVGTTALKTGSVTTPKLADSSVTAIKIISNSIDGTQLKSTTVTAGTYTNTNLTVDADGRITSASNGTTGVTDGDKGDIDVSSSGTVWALDTNAVMTIDIQDDAVTNAKLANVATATFKGRTSSGTGDPEDLTVSQAKTLLNLTGTNSGDQTITLTGDVTGSGTGSFATTISNDVVTYAKLQNVAANSFLANTAGSVGDVQELNAGASQLAGRGSTGNISMITLGTNLSMSGTTLNATSGTTTNDIVTNGNVITSTVNGIADTTVAVRTVSNTSSANNLSTTVNGVTGSNVNIINSISNTSSTNSLSTTANGVTGSTVNIINSNVLNLSGNQLTETINGVADTSLVIGTVNANLSGNSITVNVNGITDTVLVVTHTLSSSGNVMTSTTNGVAPTANIINSISNTSSGNNLSTTANGVTGSNVSIVNSISNTSSANNLNTTVNGITGSNVSIINSNVLNLAGNQLTETINGVADTSLVIGTNLVSLSGNSITSNVNGITDTVLVIGNVTQTLSSNNLSTTVNGVVSNTVSLSSYLDNTDNQTLSIRAGKGTIDLTNSTSITLADSSATNEIQNLSYNSGTHAVDINSGTSATIPLSVADGSTLGLSAFNANDFNSTSGVISLDYTNAQKATTGQHGFLTSTDWNTFNSKVGTSRAINTTAPLSGGGDLSTDRTITTSMNTNKLIGRSTSGTGVMEEIAIGSGLTLSSGTLSSTGGYTDENAQDAVGVMIDGSLNYVDATPLLQRAALTGDVTASAGSNSTTISNDAVTYAKLQNVAANSFLANTAASTGDVQELNAGASQLAGRGSTGNISMITLGTNLSMSGTTLNATEVDGSTSNELQTVDTFNITTNQLRLSLSQDAPTYTVNLNPYLDNTDAQSLSFAAKSGADNTLNISGGSGVTITDGTGITVTRNASNQITIAANNLGDINQNGNSFGAAFRIGSNDNNTVNLEIQDTIAQTIGTDGNISLINKVANNVSALENRLTIQTNSHGTPTTGFGSGILFKAETSTTDDQDQAQLYSRWQTATHASRSGEFGIKLGYSGGALSDVFRINRALTDGQIIFGAANPLYIQTDGITTSGNYYIASGGSSPSTAYPFQLVATNINSGIALILNGGQTDASYNVFGNQNFSNTSGMKVDFKYQSNFNPTSGTGTFYNFCVDNTINQTGGANGVSGGFLINPTLTAVSSYRAIDIVPNNSSAYGIYQQGALTRNYFAGVNIFDNYFETKEISAPSTPSSGYGRVYEKTDNKLYFKNDAGTEYDLTASGSISTNVLNLSGNTMTSTVEGIADTSLVIGQVNGNLSSNSITINVNGVTDTVLVIGQHTLTSSTNSMTNIENGLSASANIINSNALSSSTNTITSTINGVANTGTGTIINTNVLNLSGNQLTETINGVADTSLVIGQLNGNLLGNTITLNVNGVTDTVLVTTHTLSSSGNVMTSNVNGNAPTANIVNSISNTSSTNSLSTTVNGVTGSTVNIINSNALSSSVNTITSTVNGVANSGTGTIINTNVLNLSGNTLTETINGVADTSLVIGINTVNLAGNEITSNVNGKTDTTLVIGVNTVNLSGNQITSNVNGKTDTTLVIGVNTLTYSSTANTLISTVNGVASSTIALKYGIDSTFYYPENYGAVANDATDDRAAIQAAIDSACNRGGGIVWINKGEFRVTTTASRGTYNSGLHLCSNVILMGTGFQSVIKSTITTSGQHIISLPHVGSNIKIMDLQIKSDSLPSGAAIFESAGITNFTMSRVKIDRGTSWGVLLKESTKGLIENCDIQNNGPAHCIELNNCNNYVVRNNWLYSNTTRWYHPSRGNGIETFYNDQGENHPYANLLEGNMIYNTGGGITIWGDSMTTVSNNTIRNICGGGIYVLTEKDGSATTVNAGIKILGNTISQVGFISDSKLGMLVEFGNHDIVIDNNYIDTVYTNNAGSGGGVGIDQQSDACIMNGNRINHCYVNGISNSGKKCVISNNLILDCSVLTINGYRGISNSGSNTVISGNSIHDTRGTARMDLCIYNPGSRCVIVSNNCSGGINGGIYDSSGDSIKNDNIE